MSTTNYTTSVGLEMRTAADGNPIFVRFCTATLLAVAFHHLVFRKGEWHLKAPSLFGAWLMSFPLLFIGELVLSGQNLVSSAYLAFLTVGCFSIAMSGSIIIYRLFFHRLGGFPGPTMARVTKLWHSFQCLEGKNHLVLKKLYQQYGDFVRTGPNEITIFHPDALAVLDGPGSKTTKSVWYDFLMPDLGITTMRNKSAHDQRRKIWTKAFSAKALPFYEEQMVEHAAKLVALIRDLAGDGKTVSFSSYVYWFSFDVMGMFALSESFDMLHNEDWHYVTVKLRRAMKILGPLSPVPWLGQLGFKFLKGRWVVKDWHSMTGWCRDRMQNRIKIDDDSALNVAAYLIADAKMEGSIERDNHLLTGDAIVAIIAGSDTIAPTLVCLFYQLALNPSMADKLYDELKEVEIADHQVLQTLPYLNALINETLRFHPAVPTGGYRDTPPEGMTIGGRYIPGNTTVVAPRYITSRLERCYQQADKFIPERWYSRPEMIKDKGSFLPFAQGRYTCLGKGLALSELRVVTSLVVSNFRFRLPPGDDGSRVEGDLRDQFTASPGQLDLIFEPRVEETE